MNAKSRQKKEIEDIATDQLIPYARNSRTHDKAQVALLAGSITEFGFTNPVLIDENNGIIAGHGRVKAAQLLNLPTVPCFRLTHLTPAQKRAYVIADNKIALNAGWDDEALAAELLQLQEEGFDTAMTGFTDEEIKDLLDSVDPSAKEGLTDDDEVPEVSGDPPISKNGDIWLLGPHRLMCGDSTDAASVVLLMNGMMADQLITDPPYNVDYTGKTKDALKIENDKKDDAGFRAFLKDAMAAAFAVMKPGASFYIFHADLEGYNFRGAVQDCGEKVRQCLIWKKQSMVMGRQDYHWQHEPCLYGWKDGAAHLWASDRKQTTILEFDRPARNDIHPTMKPVALIEYTMMNNTKGGDIVLDLFGGSGSTLIAAHKNGRHACIMELDPRYVDVIIKRWQDFSGEKAVHAETGEEFGKA